MSFPKTSTSLFLSISKVLIKLISLFSQEIATRRLFMMGSKKDMI